MKYGSNNIVVMLVEYLRVCFEIETKCYISYDCVHLCMLHVIVNGRNRVIFRATTVQERWRSRRHTNRLTGTLAKIMNRSERIYNKWISTDIYLEHSHVFSWNRKKNCLPFHLLNISVLSLVLSASLSLSLSLSIDLSTYLSIYLKSYKSSLFHLSAFSIPPYFSLRDKLCN